MSFDSAQFLRNPVRMDRQDFFMPQVAPEVKSEFVAEKGVMGGVRVQVEKDPIAELQDSMEELSMQFEEKATKKMGDRRLGEKRMKVSSNYIKAIESWLKTMPDMPGREKTEQLLRSLRQRAQQGTLPGVKEFKGELAKMTSDPSHEFALLDILDQALGPEEKELQELVSGTREELMAESGEEIRAGINLSEEVNARATTPEEMSDLRNLYRSEILGFTTPQDCFRSILASRGAGALASAIDFLRAGCGTDLSCAEPSRDPAALRRILTDLQCVQVLQTVLDQMGNLSARMAKHYGVNMKLSGEEMTGKIVSFTERNTVQESEFGEFERECGIDALLARMDFARELLGVFRKLSPRLFEVEDDRLHLIEVGEEHLDGIIAEENEGDDEDDDDEEKERRR